jgi:hypothetical protein
MPEPPTSSACLAEIPMDVLMLVLLAVLAFLSWGLVRLCEKV